MDPFQSERGGWGRGMLLPSATPLHLLPEEITNFPLDPELSLSQWAAQHLRARPTIKIPQW